MSQTIVKKNHMDIPWHDFTDAEKDEPVSKASLKEKASVIGRVGMMFLSCGTGAWRVRSSMNTMSDGTDLHSRYRAYVHKLHLF